MEGHGSIRNKKIQSLSMVYMSEVSRRLLFGEKHLHFRARISNRR